MTPREVGALVLSPSFDMATAVQAVTPESVAATIASYELAARPLFETEPGYTSEKPQERGPKVDAIRKALRLIGAKVSPTMAGEQASMWVDALVVSLAKWPANAVVSAATTAMHEPFKFLSDVDGRLHELAAEAEERAKGALMRLRRMQAEIERALNPPQPQLEAPSDPWTQEAIDRANATFAKLGILTRYRLVEGQDEPEAFEIEKPIASPENGGYTESTEGKPEDENVDGADA